MPSIPEPNYTVQSLPDQPLPIRFVIPFPNLLDVYFSNTAGDRFSGTLFRNHAIIILIFFNFVNVISTQKHKEGVNFSRLLHYPILQPSSFGHNHEKEMLKTFV